MMARGRLYGHGLLKRTLDLVLTVPALVILLPLLVLIAVAVILGSGWPVLFRHERVGQDGRSFMLMKFRSMRKAGEHGLPITGGGDTRVTAVGRFLRRTKLDELPQLFNILMGEMSIVGPRPEVPRYVALYDNTQREVLAFRPGLTDPASIAYRDEEGLLGAVPVGAREEFYIREIMPRKLVLNLEYIRGASLMGDMALIVRTFLVVIGVARP